MTGNLSEELTRLCTIPEPAMFSKTMGILRDKGARDRFIQQRRGLPIKEHHGIEQTVLAGGYAWGSSSLLPGFPKPKVTGSSPVGTARKIKSLPD